MTLLVGAGAVSKAWLVMLAMMAAQGTLLALVALALTRGNRLPPAWHSAIWMVVLVKFALPWGPALPWSLSDLIAALSASGGADAATVGPPALQPAPAAPHLWPAIGWLALALVWTIIAATKVIRATIAYRRTVRAARNAPAAPAFARHVLATLAERVHVRTPKLVIGDGTTGPHVIGLVRTTIVIPPALLDEPALLRATLLHELAHVRRRDVLGRGVQLWTSAICFFWPVARLVGRRLDAAREAACDAWALDAGQLSRPAYARLLVKMAALRTSAAPSLVTPHALDIRIATVLGPPMRARLGGAHRLALAAWIAVALGGARSAAAHGTVICKYTPQLAEALYQSHPEADLDGDGTLSRDEACALQADLRRRAAELASKLDPESEAELETLLSEPLCCNCDRAEANSPPDNGSCHQVEGVDPR